MNCLFICKFFRDFIKAKTLQNTNTIFNINDTQLKYIMVLFFSSFRQNDKIEDITKKLPLLKVSFKYDFYNKKSFKYNKTFIKIIFKS